MEASPGYGYYSESENRFIEAPRKQAFRIQIPYILRFALAWTIFFAVVGIAIQSYRYSAFEFTRFFSSNYADWFRAFGNFSDTTVYPNVSEFLMALAKDWYYFFYTGGLIALIWGIISWMVHFEFVVKSPMKKNQEIKPTEEEKSLIEKLLERGKLAISENKLNEAETIYNKLRFSYDSAKDKDHKIYKQILDFYDDISELRKNKSLSV